MCGDIELKMLMGESPKKFFGTSKRASGLFSTYANNGYFLKIKPTFGILIVLSYQCIIAYFKDKMEFFKNITADFASKEVFVT